MKSNTRWEYLSVEKNPSSILNIFRIVSGTVNIKDNYLGKIHKIRENHLNFPTQINQNVNYKTILDNFDDSIKLNDLNKYFKHARWRNKKFYDSLEVELIKCIVACNEKKYLDSFFYLYRILEGISYSVPLIYVSKKNDYNKTYSDLKSYFGNEKDGELNFFRRFVSETFGKEDFYKSTININMDEIPIDEIKAKYYLLYLGKINPRFVVDKDESNFIKVKYIGYFDLLIELRNRFFHNLKGTWQENFDSTELMYPDLFFKPIIHHGINWLSIVIFEIIKFDFAKIK